jgi:hypothetical protein
MEETQMEETEADGTKFRDVIPIPVEEI